MRPEQRGEAAREADDARFRDAVPKIGVGAVGGDGREVDDPAGLARDHLLRQRTNQLDRRFEIHGEDAPSRFLGVAVDGDRSLHAGVIDEDVDLAERLGHSWDAGDVGKVVDDIARLAIEADDVTVGLAQRLGSGAADAARRAGDERRLRQPTPAW